MKIKLSLCKSKLGTHKYWSLFAIISKSLLVFVKVSIRHHNFVKAASVWRGKSILILKYWERWETVLSYPVSVLLVHFIWCNGLQILATSVSPIPLLSVVDSVTLLLKPVNVREVTVNCTSETQWKAAGFCSCY